MSQSFPEAKGIYSDDFGLKVPPRGRPSVRISARGNLGFFPPSFYTAAIKTGEAPILFPGPEKSVRSGIFKPARRYGLVETNSNSIAQRTPEEVVDYCLRTITPRRDEQPTVLEEPKTENHKSFFQKG